MAAQPLEAVAAELEVFIFISPKSLQESFQPTRAPANTASSQKASQKTVSLLLLALTSSWYYPNLFFNIVLCCY